MPKYYCDYCDTFLTHDSPSVRKTHNGGRKHKENVRMYYQGWMEQQAQKLVDATARAFTAQQRLGPRPAIAPPGAPAGFPYPIMPPMPGSLPRPPIGMPGIPLPSMPAAAYPPMPAGIPFPTGVAPPMPQGIPFPNDLTN